MFGKGILCVLFLCFFCLLLMTWFFRWRNIKEFHMIILVYKKYGKFVGICWFIRIQPSNRNSFIFFIFTETINIVRYYNLYLKMNGHFQIPVCFIKSKWFFSKEFQQFHFLCGNIHKKTDIITVYDCCKYQINVLIIYIYIYICTAIEANVVIYQQLYVLIYCCSYLSLYTKSACRTSV